MTEHTAGNKMMRCVIVGGAEIGDYERMRAYLRDDDYMIYCDSGLCHIEGLGRMPSLIIGDFDSHENPHLDIETIVLPVAKDDTDTMHAVKVGIERGFTDFLLLGVIGGRIDHSLVNLYALFYLDSHGCKAMAADDHSEIEALTSHEVDVEKEPRALQEHNADLASHELDADKSKLIIVPGTASVEDRYPFFSLVAMAGTAHGVTIRGAKFPLEDGDITPDYQYATSNEVLPGQTAEITVRDGRLLLIKDFE